MDPAVCLLHLHQGNRAIEDYVQEFVELAHLTGAIRTNQVAYAATRPYLEIGVLYQCCIAAEQFNIHCGNH